MTISSEKWGIRQIKSIWLSFRHTRTVLYRTYPDVFSGGLFLCASAVVTVGWLCSEIANEDVGYPFEPAAILLALIAAYKLGHYVVDNALFLRAESPQVEPALVDRGDVELWRRFNHSFHEINWTPNFPHGERAIVSEFFRKHAPKWHGGFTLIEKLQEEGYNRHYRVINWLGPAFYVRVNPRLGKEGSVQDLDSERRLLAARYLLENSARLPFWHHAIDCQIRLARETYPHSVFNPVDGTSFELFWYLDQTSHFAGRHSQLMSFAKALGSVQSVFLDADDDSKFRDQVLKIQHLEQNAAKELRVTAAINDTITAETVESLRGENKENFTKMLLAAEQGRAITAVEREGINIAYDLYCKNAEEQVAWSKNRKRVFCLHDLHPFNTFFNGDKCELIYDYSWLGLWHLEYTTAFTIHRFVREWLIVGKRQNEMPDVRIEQGLPEVISEFFAEFSEALGDKNTLDQDFLKRLPNFILAANTSKFLSQVEKHTGTQDRAGLYSERERWHELIKFVNVAHEAQRFRVAT